MENKELKISICRPRSWAVFDGFKCLEGFHDYTNEEDALVKAKAYCAEHGSHNPEVVYPTITRMTMSSRSVRRRKR